MSNILQNIPLYPKKKTQGIVGLMGIVKIQHFRDGKLLSEEVIRNTITNVGKDKVASLLSEAPTPASALFKWLAIGNSGTAAAAANTLLVGEVQTGTLARASSTASKVTTTVAGDTRRLVKTFTKDFATPATTSIREVGVFNTSTKNVATMLGRTTFSVKNLSQNDTLRVQYDLIVS